MLRSLLILLGTTGLTGFAEKASTPTSGLVGIYGIVQRVHYEPNTYAPERVRIWGAFAFVNGGLARQLEVTTALKGQLYFSLPMREGGSNAEEISLARKEWADILSVAGTGQAIGFGSWSYSGAFSIDARSPGSFSSSTATASNAIPLRSWVRIDSDTTSMAIPYTINAGVVKITEASHAAVVRQLRAVFGSGQTGRGGE